MSVLSNSWHQCKHIVSIFPENASSSHQKRKMENVVIQRTSSSKQNKWYLEQSKSCFKMTAIKCLKTSAHKHLWREEWAHSSCSNGFQSEKVQAVRMALNILQFIFSCRRLMEQNGALQYKHVKTLNLFQCGLWELLKKKKRLWLRSKQQLVPLPACCYEYMLNQH